MNESQINSQQICRFHDLLTYEAKWDIQLWLPLTHSERKSKVIFSVASTAKSLKNIMSFQDDQWHSELRDKKKQRNKETKEQIKRKQSFKINGTLS